MAHPVNGSVSPPPRLCKRCPARYNYLRCDRPLHLLLWQRMMSAGVRTLNGDEVVRACVVAAQRLCGDSTAHRGAASGLSVGSCGLFSCPYNAATRVQRPAPCHASLSGLAQGSQTRSEGPARGLRCCLCAHAQADYYFLPLNTRAHSAADDIVWTVQYIRATFPWWDRNGGGGRHLIIQTGGRLLLWLAKASVHLRLTFQMHCPIQLPPSNCCIQEEHNRQHVLLDIACSHCSYLSPPAAAQVTWACRSCRRRYSSPQPTSRG